ncbi:MAG: hypothetical protein IT463_03485 [Planctomycetes bacterium]|nr:hypothetical protein [Planctomycetota bacterium]
MDAKEFRRLAADAVAGRLDPETRQRVLQAAEADPEHARFYAQLVAAHNGVTQRMQAPRPADAPAPAPRGISNAQVWGLRLIFGVAGALAGGMVAWGVIGDMNSPPSLPGNDASWTRANHPAGNHPPANQPARNTAAQPAANQAPANTATLPPANQPAANTAQPPANEVVPPSLPPALLRVTAGAESRLRVQRAGAADYADLAPGEGLNAGDRLALVRGTARLEAEGLLLLPAEKAELELTGPGAFTLRKGRVAFACFDGGWVAACNEAMVELDGSGALQVQRGGDELSVLEGTARVTLGSESAQVTGPRLLLLLRGLQQTALPAMSADALAAELHAHEEVLLGWDFESGPGACDLGEASQPGAGGSRGALRWRSTDSGVGAGGSTALFTMREEARLRLRVRTGSPRLRVTLKQLLPDGFRRVDMAVPLRGQGWQLVEVPLSLLRAQRGRESGFVPGALYAALQFEILPEPGEAFAGYTLEVDDVCVYAPRR